MTIRLKGGPELLRLLDELPKNLERNVIRGGLRAGAKVIQQQAKANVPVRTGQLKRAIAGFCSDLCRGGHLSVFNRRQFAAVPLHQPRHQQWREFFQPHWSGG